MNKIYYIDLDREKRNTAGAKAPDDIAELCRRGGYHRISMPLYPRDKSKLIQKIWLLTVCTCNWWRIMHCVEEDSIIIYQHPQYGVRIAEKMIPMVQRKRNCKFVTVVHDLESLRGGIEGVIKNNSRTNKLADSILLRHMDCLICHNEKMKDYLVKMGYAQEKIVCLELFDYLNNVQRVQRVKDQIPSIAIAGNLAAGKCKYIYDICKNGQNRNLTIHLYGNNYDSKTSTKNMIWHGSFSPEELPAHLTGDFGLVWDGTSIKTCAGNTGRYLVLCQDLVQVKMRNFSHFNPPEAQPQCVFFYTIVRIHLVTYSYNGYEFVSYCRKLPDIRKSSGMLAYNHGF